MELLNNSTLQVHMDHLYRTEEQSLWPKFCVRLLYILFFSRVLWAAVGSYRRSSENPSNTTTYTFPILRNTIPFVFNGLEFLGKARSVLKLEIYNVVYPLLTSILGETFPVYPRSASPSFGTISILLVVPKTAWTSFRTHISSSLELIVLYYNSVLE